MFLIKSVLVILLSNLIAINCKNLPNYIESCSRSDPEINKCVKNKAIAALPGIIKGDKDRKLPPLSPYNIAKIDIDAGNNLKITFKDAILTGLDTVEITDATINLEKKVLEIKAKTGKIALTGNYVIDGRILILPITGNGKGSINLDNIKCEYTLNYDVVKKDDGKEYFVPVKSQLVIDPEVTHYDFENLFNGDKTLGDEMRKFLNENHKEVGKELNPGYAKIVETIVNTIIDNTVKDLLYDDVLKP